MLYGVSSGAKKEWKNWNGIRSNEFSRTEWMTFSSWHHGNYRVYKITILQTIYLFWLHRSVTDVISSLAQWILTDSPKAYRVPNKVNSIDVFIQELTMLNVYPYLYCASYILDFFSRPFFWPMPGDWCHASSTSALTRSPHISLYFTQLFLAMEDISPAFPILPVDGLHGTKQDDNQPPFALHRKMANVIDVCKGLQGAVDMC
jgi:hypothetical protein